MVNEERLHHMIKMAIFDTNQGKECKPMTQYARKDYSSKFSRRSSTALAKPARSWASTARPGAAAVTLDGLWWGKIRPT